MVTLTSACASHLVLSPQVVVIREYSQEIPVRLSQNPEDHSKVKDPLKEPFASHYFKSNVDVVTGAI